MLLPGLFVVILALLAQQPTITVRGRAVDTTGAGLKRVSVTPWVNGQRQPALESPESSDGSFVVTGIPADSVLLEIGSLGFRPNHCRVGDLTPGETVELQEVTLQVAPLCGPFEVTLEVDPLAAVLEGVLASNAIIKGAVVDRNSQPLRGVTMTIMESPSSKPLHAIRQSASSSFRFGSLQAGDYVLEFSLPGFTTARRTVTLKEAQLLELPPVQLHVSGKIVCDALGPR